MTIAEKPPFLTVQAGPRNAYTDPDSGLRFYHWQGRDLPSVTSVRRMAGLPFGLHNWTVNQVIDAALDRRSEIIDRLSAAEAITNETGFENAPAGYASVRQVVRTELRAAGTAERDRAAQLGTAVHDAVARGARLEDLLPELQPRVRQARSWLATSGAEIVGSEFQVFNLTEGYAGTVDALVRFPNGQLWLVDYKTGKGIYSDHALQVVAYVQAELVGSDDVVDEELSSLLGQVTGTAVLHLADDQWAFHVVRYDQETWDAFRGLLRFAMWTHTHSRPADFVTASREGAAA